MMTGQVMVYKRGSVLSRIIGDSSALRIETASYVKPTILSILQIPLLNIVVVVIIHIDRIVVVEGKIINI